MEYIPDIWDEMTNEELRIEARLLSHRMTIEQARAAQVDMPPDVEAYRRVIDQQMRSLIERSEQTDRFKTVGRLLRDAEIRAEGFNSVTVRFPYTDQVRAFCDAMNGELEHGDGAHSDVTYPEEAVE